ncbi:molybdopterin-dependent oxidoreductase [Pedobacter miscanthi]|uniref:Molybdopterin-binding protein n=1 Tax=Pedobacter miscanthi TaxID=2259170 RepID=A0A366LDI5_9SPHI|nr:molybdopterin-dependent oxidoreductase [Pedobacter miscanthi]RBQ11927.1 molybdopterin-binding protein [Pedobacter miscanthi]
MKYTIIALLFLAFSAKAQESKQFTIEGKVKTPLTVTLDNLSAYKSVNLDSMTIFNHLMQRKSSIKNIKGVLLKDILAKVEIDAASPKTLSEYYLVFTATDNYKVVYSWNEIFNSSTGDQILVLKSYDTDPSKAEKGNIAIITPTDFATGRRFVKGLSKISILQVN